MYLDTFNQDQQVVLTNTNTYPQLKNVVWIWMTINGWGTRHVDFSLFYKYHRKLNNILLDGNILYLFIPFQLMF